MVCLVSAGKIKRIPLFFWISPALVLIIGLVAIVHPIWIASAPLIIIGWSLLLYGVTEVINALKINTDRRHFEKTMMQSATTDAHNPGDNYMEDDSAKKE